MTTPQYGCANLGTPRAAVNAPDGALSRRFVGGASTLFRIAKDMHEAMKADSVVGSMFARAADTHVPHLGMWLCEVFGGPALYSETLGDIGPILNRHAKLDIAEAQRAALLACAKRTVERHVEPGRARDAIIDYFDWGTHVAVDNSKPDHVLDPSAGVPKWDCPS